MKMSTITAVLASAAFLVSVNLYAGGTLAKPGNLTIAGKPVTDEKWTSLSQKAQEDIIAQKKYNNEPKQFRP